ncbi:hypothetical protein XELAEV_18007997mg [Xenopus laevis]|uniref:Uncharacterized protein n=1 Tax=Xenopus laevis TaxID=8355 RepID=A0A974E2Y6_XENLA|nr:hypothetical protein XELAEV_18007997mg [Xenopus laevis]
MSVSHPGSACSLPENPKDGTAHDTGYRYVWKGIFVEKVTQHGDLIIVPLCGDCGCEAYVAIGLAEGRCNGCQEICWLGPLKDEVRYRAPVAVLALVAAPHKSSRTGSIHVSTLSMNSEVEEREAAATRKITAMLAEPPDSFLEKLAALPELVEGVALDKAAEIAGPTEVSASVLSPTEEGEAISGGQEVATGPGRESDLVPTDSGDGVGPEEISPPPPYRQAIQKMPPAYPEKMGTPQQSQGAGSVSDWEEDMAEAEQDGATHEPLFHLPHSFWVPPKITKAEEKDFWVLPGKAYPDIFCRVSRIQRVINFCVFRLWGYYMPYAPLWVYDKMEHLVDDWVVEDICSKEKSIGNSLTHPDTVKRMAAWRFVRSIEKEWCWGCTVLRHRVHSCRRNNPNPQLFSIDVATPGGHSREASP